MFRFLGFFIMVFIFLTDVASSTFASRNFGKISGIFGTTISLESMETKKMLGFHAESKNGEADDEETSGSDNETSEASPSALEKYILSEKKIFLPSTSIVFLRLGSFPLSSVDLYPPEKPPRA